MDDLLPARVDAIVSGAIAVTGSFPRVRLDTPSAHGTRTLVLADNVRIPLPPSKFVSGTVSGSHWRTESERPGSRVIRIVLDFGGWTCDLSFLG